MFTCKDSVNLLMELLDGEMSAAEEGKLREHLEACPPCVDFLRTYRATSGLCRRALKSKMPQELADKLTDFLRARTQEEK
jgi:anti-sigma factor (TIGR02949 family)